MSKKILLFPGGFKPFHDGHLSILKSHIFNMDNVHIDEVRIYISYKDRENITADTSLWFLNNIKDNLSELYQTDIIPQISDIPSPVGKCYNDVSTNMTHDLFSLVSSNKGSDIDRKISFINAYLTDGKKYDIEKGEQTINVNADIEPICYYNRTDGLNGSFVSSTIVRNDIKNRDFNLFKTAYTYMLDNNIITEENLYKYYKILIDLILRLNLIYLYFNKR